MRLIRLQETESTNTWLSRHAGDMDDMTIVTTVRQTAGRGQRGNTWESEDGRNITMSLLWLPAEFPARDQFAASEAVALAVADTLADYGISARVKWPNDIYCGDRKIAGILIEHAVTGRYITRTIAGIGLNVNQHTFISDAPNPVSMFQLSGHETDLEAVLHRLAAHLEKRLSGVCDDDSCRALHAEYMESLWRGDGRMYPFATPDGTHFDAAIAGVDADGMLTLIDATARQRRFAFKEVSFIL